MNKKDRKNKLNQLKKQAEQDALLKKVAEEFDQNDASDAEEYSEKIFLKLLDSIKIEGLED